MNTTAQSEPLRQPTCLEAFNYVPLLACSHYERKTLLGLRFRLRKARLTLPADPDAAKAAIRDTLALLIAVTPYHSLDPRLERRINDRLNDQPSPYGLKGCVRRLEGLLRTVSGLKISTTPCDEPALRRDWFRTALRLGGRR